MDIHMSVHVPIKVLKKVHMFVEFILYEFGIQKILIWKKDCKVTTVQNGIQ